LQGIWSGQKAAEDCRTPRRFAIIKGRLNSARSWSAAVLCRFSATPNVRFALLNRPALAVFALDVVHRAGEIGDLEVGRIPLDFLAGAVRNNAQQNGFGKAAGIIEIARRWRAGFARLNPFVMMANRRRDGRLRRLESLELRFGQQTEAGIVC